MLAGLVTRPSVVEEGTEVVTTDLGLGVEYQDGHKDKAEVRMDFDHDTHSWHSLLNQHTPSLSNSLVVLISPVVNTLL